MTAGLDEHWMRRSLELAAAAAEQGEVPVGAVLVDAHGEQLAEGWNQPISTRDCSAHAEMLCLRAGCATAGNYRLPGSSLFVTLEPCVMCAGAIIQARISRLVFGAFDPKAGAAGSVYDILSHGRLNHRLAVTGGVLGEDCGELLRTFFRRRRD